MAKHVDRVRLRGEGNTDVSGNPVWLSSDWSAVVEAFIDGRGHSGGGHPGGPAAGGDDRAGVLGEDV